MLERIFSIDTLWWVLMIIYVPACIGLIVIVLLQKGKGTGFAGAFGAGAGPGADTVFGPRMSRSLPIRLTYIAAACFMIIAVIMSLIGGRVGKGMAPELVPEDEMTAAQTNSGALSALGMGTNRADQSRFENVKSTPPTSEEGTTGDTAAAGSTDAGMGAAPATDESASAAADTGASETTQDAGTTDSTMEPAGTAEQPESAPATEENPVSQ